MGSRDGPATGPLGVVPSRTDKEFRQIGGQRIRATLSMITSTVMLHRLEAWNRVLQWRL
jgi:hypothetical protein